jgi:hypothetical protein
VREFVGEDGELIATYMVSVMKDERARTADRIEAGKWLADRAFGRSVQTHAVDVTTDHYIDVTKVSDEDPDALMGIVERYTPNLAGSKGDSLWHPAGAAGSRLRGRRPILLPPATTSPRLRRSGCSRLDP